MANNNQGNNQYTKQGNNQSDNRGNNQYTQQGNNQSGNQGNQGSGNQGFASMDPQRQREIASEGGRAAHASGNAHEFNSQEARDAGSMSHKNGNQQSGNQGNQANQGNQGNQGNQQSGQRGGTPEQHAEAGRQSHKNDQR